MGALKSLEDKLGLAIDDTFYWPEVCDEIAKLLGGNNALLIPSEPNFRGLWLACTKDLLPALEQYVADGWHLNDFRQNTIPIIIERGYATDDDILPSRAEMSTMPYYTDFLWKHNIGYFIGLKVTTPNGIWVAATYFHNDHPPITNKQVTLTKSISELLEAKIAQADIEAHKQIANFVKFFKGTQLEIYILDPQDQNCFRVDVTGKIYNEYTMPSLLTETIMSDIHNEISYICSSKPELSVSNSYIIKHQSKRLNVLAIQVPPFLRHFHSPFKVCLIVTEIKERILEIHKQ